ncbi:substrate-binding domain-containing protein [Chromohalobacter israelensis]|uniref:substrate-binding domain-containing protein n=1 Tax=Chromohalobacter TaxID=42054 RepID=UPI001DF9C99E|nr:substrate-binding domain-containing protein [Chromohalobacter sp.]NQY44904.1 substrate-binding domain-containing protein [Chromohalobacter sp.]
MNKQAFSERYICIKFVIPAAQQAGRGIPRRAKSTRSSIGASLSLVGYNDIPLASRLPVSLTSVHIPFDYVAHQAVELLFSERPPGADCIRRAMPSLIPRASSVRYP